MESMSISFFSTHFGCCTFVGCECVYVYMRPYNFQINKLSTCIHIHRDTEIGTQFFFFMAIEVPFQPAQAQWDIHRFSTLSKKYYLYFGCQRIALKPEYEWNEFYELYTKWELLMDFHLLQIHNCFFCCCCLFVAVYSSVLASPLFFARLLRFLCALCSRVFSQLGKCLCFEVIFFSICLCICAYIEYLWMSGCVYESHHAKR